jgi:hypothetical protein
MKCRNVNSKDYTRYTPYNVGLQELENAKTRQVNLNKFKKLNSCHAIKHIKMRYPAIARLDVKRKDIDLINHVLQLGAVPVVADDDAVPVVPVVWETDVQVKRRQKYNYNTIPNTMNKTFLAKVNKALNVIRNRKRNRNKETLCAKAKEAEMTGHNYAATNTRFRNLVNLRCSHNTNRTTKRSFSSSSISRVRAQTVPLSVMWQPSPY